MKIQPFIDKIQSSAAFKDFQKKYKSAYLVAGFFVIDFESGQNINQIDYYVPSEKKVAAFTLGKQVTVQLLDVINSKVPEKIATAAKVDLDSLHGILEDEMKNRSITEDIKKIIAVVQSIEGRMIWSLNCVLSGMSILNAHVEDDSESVLKMERKSIVDYMRKMPMQPPQQAPQAQPAASESAEDKLKKLEELEAAIKEEKAALAKAAPKKANPNIKTVIISDAPPKSVASAPAKVAKTKKK